jgi:staphyloferrin B biosynthesis citrate synthase
MSVAADFKSRLLAGAPLLGTFVKTPHPSVVEVLAQTGLDCLCLDAEHAPFDRVELDRGILAARAGGMPALVRVASASPHEILNALDLGAAGVVVPHVRSAEEAQAAVRACHYGAGGRGYAGGTRASAYASPPIGDRLVSTRAQTSVILQIEDVEALEHPEAIAATEGVDAVFIGRIDLTVALGETDPKAPRVMAAVSQVVAACRAVGRTVGLFTPDLSEVPSWREQGVSLFLLGADHAFIRAGATRMRVEAGL